MELALQSSKVVDHDRGHPVERVTERDLGEILPLVRAYCEFHRVNLSDDELLTVSRALTTDPARERVQFIARDDAGLPAGFATLLWSWTRGASGRIGLRVQTAGSPAERYRHDHRFDRGSLSASDVPILLLMTVKEWIEREKYVAIHGQTLRFRIVKYLVLVAFAGAIYAWNGWTAVAVVFLTLSILAIAVHFFFRWKTKGWTESWGPYKKLDISK